MTLMNVLPSAILVSVIFSLTEAEQYPNLKSSKSAHQSSPYSFSSSSSPDVTRRSSSGYPSYDAFVDSRYEFPSSPVSGTDGDILESSDHSNVEDYTQPASNPSPVVVIPLKFGQRRQVKQHHSSSYYLPKISQGYSTRRPYEGEPTREFSDNNFRTFSDYFNHNYDQSREQQNEPTDGGWRGWRGIPTPGHAGSNRNNNHEMVATTSPPHNENDRFHNNHFTSDHHANEIPTHQPRSGWRPRNNNHNQARHLKRTVSRRPVQSEPEESSNDHHQPDSSYDIQHPKPFDHQPVYEPSKFWQPGEHGFDSVNQNDPSSSQEDSRGGEEEDMIEEQQSPLPPRSARGRQKMMQESGGRVQRGAIKASESRAQGVIVTGKDLDAEAGHHSGGHHGYFQYVRVPHKGAWEFGYRRGNHGHFTERHEQGHGHHFKTKVRWGDKHGGYGEHYWDYNHHGKSDHYDHHDDGHHGKHHHKFAAASNQDQVTSTDSISPASGSPRSPF